MNWISTIAWILLPQIGGILGGLATSKQIKTWYEKLLKPSWRPPNWVFGPVWTILYLCMGAASYLIVRDGQGSFKTLALTFYFIQLFINWIWTPVFFVLHQLGAALVIILILFINIFICILQFWEINSYAAMLLVPYLLWVGFASALTMSIWQLNSPYAQPPPRRPRPITLLVMSLSKAALGLIFLPHLGGFMGGFITKKNIKEWYEKLDRPTWRPPNWAFAPVWTTLYTMMGYASYLIYRDGHGQSRNTALALYGSQLALNWLWTPIFFGYHKLGLALAEMLLLLGNIGLCIGAFYPINRTASYLLVPYLGWVTLASSLTYSVWQRNKTKEEKFRK